MTDPQSWISCPECESDAAGIIDWRPDNETTLTCPDCGAIEEAAYCGDEFAKEVYGDD